jgi:glycine hydroxymethyltransferase
VTSGLRIGSPAVTTRGFKEQDCIDLTGWICDILENIEDQAVSDSVKAKVAEICGRLPVYAE